MVQKARLRFNLIGIILLSLLIINCNNKEKDQKSFSLEVDTSMIPKDTILSNNPKLILDNGIYLLDNQAFSGYINEKFNDTLIALTGSYWNGKQEGETKTFFPNGKLKDTRSYKDGKAYGKHIGFWENGNKKFDFIYINDKREGEQKQWYESGKPYAFLTFKDDREEGMQKAWRENGKAYINYEAKDGFRYGLQKAALCYTLRDGKIKE